MGLKNAFDLTGEQAGRYQRNILLKGVGPEGQEKLFHSGVLLVGAGGLGSPAAFYLAAAGVGRIGLIDNDTVSLSNLQRQILYNTLDLGCYKVVSAAEKLKAPEGFLAPVWYPTWCPVPKPNLFNQPQ